jgi:hypothetical protein
MAIASREYVSLRGLGHRHECEVLRDELLNWTRKQNAIHQRASIFLRIMLSDEDVEDEVWSEEIIEQIVRLAARRYPFLWLNITYNPETLTESELETVETQYQLARTATALRPEIKWEDG